MEAGGKILRSESHKLIHSLWNKEELSQLQKESVIVPVYCKEIRAEFVIPFLLLPSLLVLHIL
jgi:hypothetical protein